MTENDNTDDNDNLQLPAGLGDILGGGLMGKLNEMQTNMRRAQEELAAERMTISVGGDAVQVVVDGQQRFHHLTISPEALQAALTDREMLEDLILAAVNSALEQSQMLAADRLRGLSAGLGLPGFGG
jgi:DNA-binding YbaB/EbfC family protein